jgi:hypothetical protein
MDVAARQILALNQLGLHHLVPKSGPAELRRAVPPKPRGPADPAAKGQAPGLGSPGLGSPGLGSNV